MNKEKLTIPAMFEGCIDILINFLTLIAAYMTMLAFFEPVVRIDDYMTIFSLFIILVFSAPVYQVCNTYKKIPFVGSYRYAYDIVKANIIIYLASMTVFLLLTGADVSVFIFYWGSLSFIFSSGALIFKKRMIVSIVRVLRRKNYTVRRVIIVGDNTDSANAFVKQALDDPNSAMIILGAVGRSMKNNMLCDHLGDFESLEEILDTYKPDDVVFAIDSYNKSNLISLVNMCDDRCIKVYFLPVIYGFFKTIRQVERVGNLPIINIHSTPLDSKFNRAVKRTFDIIVSLLMIILTAPLMLAIAIGVRLSSDGPILFRQERVGRLGKSFKMYKFRSMHVTSTQDNTWTTAEDTRRTRFGAFLRRSSLDELPQLFNVLVGDMSIIGPRPEVPHFVEHFKNEVPLYMVKHYVKPGITGLAQVKRLRGNTPVEDRIAADISYIENWSLLLDISILLKTPFKAYNSDEKYVDLAKLDVGTDEDIAFDFSTMKSMPAPTAETVISGRGGKKILYCASRMVHINNFHKDYISALGKDGNEVKILAYGKGADFDIPFEKKIFSWGNFRQIKRIRSIITEGKFDVIVLNTSLAAFFVRLALPRKSRPRVINFVHGYLFSKHINPIKSRLLFLCEKLLRKQTDDVIVMNTVDYRTAVKKRLCRERVFFVKGMGAEVREVMTSPDRIRNEYNCSDKYVMTFVGELSARKNQEFLIRSLPKIQNLIPSAVLWLVGDGNDADKLKKLACDLGIEESVLFMGSRADACDFVRASNLYVSASSIEGMPFNIIEALGIGVPIVASRIKGHIDIISDRKDGCLYDFNSVDDFITKVYKIYTKSIRISKESMILKYNKYTKESVFKDTFSVLMCAAFGMNVCGDTAPASLLMNEGENHSVQDTPKDFTSHGTDNQSTSVHGTGFDLAEKETDVKDISGQSTDSDSTVQTAESNNKGA